jgi:anti-sigma factor RsiW
MICQEFCDFLMDYLDGNMPGPSRWWFERHIARCKECAAYLRSYQAVVRLEKSLCYGPDEPVLAVVPERLIEAILRTARVGVLPRFERQG